jgi:hypothetical protein
MTPLEALRGQLDMFTHFRRITLDGPQTYPYLCAEDLIQQRGVVFERSLEEPPIHAWPRACFQRSYQLAQRRRKWIYCEGFALSPHGLCVHHAWAIHRDRPRKAVELAWNEGTPDDTAYLGIPFRREFVRDTYAASKRKLYCVLYAYWLDFPLLTGRVKLDDVMVTL